MSKHGKIKSKVVQSTLNNRDVLEMFHSILGTNEGMDLNIKIVYPKYLKIVEHCTRFMCLLEALHDSDVMKYFPRETEHLASYVSSLREQATEVFSAPDLAALHPPGQQLSEHLVDYQAITKSEYDAFAVVYKATKSSNLVNTIIVTCNNLVPHKKSLEYSSALKERFLTHSAGLSFAPLPDLPAMNFKQIYISDRLSQTNKQFIMMVLHKLFMISHDVYETMSSPDIDVEEFVQIIIGSLEDVKKHIPRCNEAFDKIRDSVDLLKKNFGGYYKDYVASNNPTIIMENFVLDVSKSTKSSPKVTAQFRRIISHYRKLASHQVQHPQMRSLFTQVDKNFQELEKRSRNADIAEESENSDDALLDSNEKAAEEEHNAEHRREKNRKRRRQRRNKAERRLEESIMATIDDGVDLDEQQLEESATNDDGVSLGEELNKLTQEKSFATTPADSNGELASSILDGEEASTCP